MLKELSSINKDYLFMQVMTKTYDRTLGSYSGLMVELVKVTVKKSILGTGIL